jgi:hypothetical protein
MGKNEIVPKRNVWSNGEKFKIGLSLMIASFVAYTFMLSESECLDSKSEDGYHNDAINTTPQFFGIACSLLGGVFGGMMTLAGCCGDASNEANDQS